MRDMKMGDWKMRNQTAMVGQENAGPICKGGRCGTR